MMKIATVIALVVLAILALMYLSPLVMAAGIGVSPERLDVEVAAGKSTSVTFQVNNPPAADATASQYQIYVEGEKAPWFTFEPAEFLLQPDETQRVDITISPSTDASGHHLAIIKIVSFSLDDQSGFGAGIMLDCGVTIISESPLTLPRYLAIAGSIAVIAVTIGITWRQRRRRMGAYA